MRLTVKTYCFLPLIAIAAYGFFEIYVSGYDENRNTTDTNTIPLNTQVQKVEETPCARGQIINANGTCQEVSAVVPPIPSKTNQIVATEITTQLRSSGGCRGQFTAALVKSGVDCEKENQKAAGLIKELAEQARKGDGRSASELGKELGRQASQKGTTADSKEYQEVLNRAEEELYKAAVSGNKAAALAYYSRGQEPID